MNSLTDEARYKLNAAIDIYYPSGAALQKETAIMWAEFALTNPEILKLQKLINIEETHLKFATASLNEKPWPEHLKPENLKKYLP